MIHHSTHSFACYCRVPNKFAHQLNTSDGELAEGAMQGRRRETKAMGTPIQISNNEEKEWGKMMAIQKGPSAQQGGKIAVCFKC